MSFNKLRWLQKTQEDTELFAEILPVCNDGFVGSLKTIFPAKLGKKTVLFRFSKNVFFCIKTVDWKNL